MMLKIQFNLYNLVGFFLAVLSVVERGLPIFPATIMKLFIFPLTSDFPHEIESSVIEFLLIYDYNLPD